MSISRGGIVPKADVPLAGGGKGQPHAQMQNRDRLCVEDPITGRDVASGSHLIATVGGGSEGG